MNNERYVLMHMAGFTLGTREEGHSTFVLHSRSNRVYSKFDEEHSVFASPLVCCTRSWYLRLAWFSRPSCVGQSKCTAPMRTKLLHELLNLILKGAVTGLLSSPVSQWVGGLLQLVAIHLVASLAWHPQKNIQHWYKEDGPKEACIAFAVPTNLQAKTQTYVLAAAQYRLVNLHCCIPQYWGFMI